MKIIALLPFKNEEWVLPVYLKSVSKIVDEIIAIDDGSSDKSKQLIEDYGGIVFDHNFKKNDWAMSKIRQKLLELGRSRKGTHFVCLDADEAFTSNFIIPARTIIKQMIPGQKISMHWLALWKSKNFYRDDSSVWSNNYKDFIFCDDGVSSYENAFFSESRTPGSNELKNVIQIDSAVGSVLHYQFLFWERFQIKQAWYRCEELVNSPNSIDSINEMYSITFDDPLAQLKEVPKSWLIGIEAPKFDRYSWHLDEIKKLFKKHGAEFFEGLQIWHIHDLRCEFYSLTGRHPKRITKYTFTLNFFKFFNNLSLKIKKVFCGK